MNFLFGLIVLLLSLRVNSQSLTEEISSLPSCSSTCLDTATTSAGCTSGDYSCFCDDQNGNSQQSAIVSSASDCLQNACSLLDADSTLTVVGQICSLINSPTTSITSSSSSTSSTSSRSTTSTSTSTTSQKTTTTSASSMAPTSSSSTSTSASSSPSSTSTVSSHKSNGGGLSPVAEAMIVLAIAAFLLLLAIGMRCFWKQRAKAGGNGKFENIENGTPEKPVELQGNDTQLYMFGGIGVRQSIRINAGRLSAFMPGGSNKNGNRREAWDEPRSLLSTVEEGGTARGLSRDPSQREETSRLRSDSNASTSSDVSISPPSPEDAPLNSLYPAGHSRSLSQSKRVSLPPVLPALSLGSPGITLATPSKPSTPDAYVSYVPNSPPPPETSRVNSPPPLETSITSPPPLVTPPTSPTKSFSPISPQANTVARLDRPFSDYPYQFPPARVASRNSMISNRHSIASNDNSSNLKHSFSNRYRHSMAYPIPVVPEGIPRPPEDPVSPMSAARSYHTFGGYPGSPASISTFSTFPNSPIDFNNTPPMPPMASLFPMSTSKPITHNANPTPTRSTSQGQVFHSKQTSLAKINSKPKMIYISNTPGIEVVPADSIFASNDPRIQSNLETGDGKGKRASTGSVVGPIISIEPTIDRSSTLSSYGSQSSSGKSKLRPAYEAAIQEGPDIERYQERQKQRRAARKSRLSKHGSAEFVNQAASGSNSNLDEPPRTAP